MSAILFPPFHDDTIISIAIGKFDLLTGVKQVYKWQFVEENLDDKIDSIFKMILTTVHRQEKSAFTDCLTTTLNIASSNWFVISSVFNICKPKDIFYSISLVFDSSKFNKDQDSIDCAVFWSKQLVTATKLIIQKNDTFDKMKPIVERAVEDIISLRHVGIKDLPKFIIDPQESQFFAIILTAHLKAGMNTIFEVNQISDCERYFNFLTHFTLPEYLKYSSSEVRKQPNMHLHLQIIDKQNLSFDEILLQSPSQRAIIRLPEKQVIITPPHGTQVEANAEFMTIRAANTLTNDQETKRKNFKSRTVQYKTKTVSSPCAIAATAVKLMDDVKNEARYLICEQRLAVIVRNAITLIALVNDFLSEKNTESISPEQTQELIKILKLKDKDDLESILPISSIYDKSIFTKVPPLKENKSIFSGNF